jgi:cytidylate kinase
MKDKISLAGDLGSGKSTVSDILIKTLGAEYYSTGAIVRSVAAKRGMTVVELNKYMETHPEIDHEIDDGLKALADVDKFLIIDSRMAWYFTPGTFKVYLSCDIETSAARIMGANRQGEHAASFEATVADTRARRESEKKRYMEQYGQNIKDLTNYSLIVDTSHATPDQVAEAIIKGYEVWKLDRAYKAAFICTERLNFHDEEVDADELAALSAALEEGRDIPEVTVFERDGDFFVKDGNASAVAYAFFFGAHVPARLIADSDDGRKYVKMKNSL